MPKEITPIDFGFEINISRVNGYPVGVRFFIRKHHNDGAQSVRVDLQQLNPLLRCMVSESVSQRYQTDEEPLRILTTSREELEAIITQEIPRYFSIIMLTDMDDDRIAEAIRFLMEAIEPYLDAAEMLELTESTP